MKLKKITLENIRSYENEIVEFPEGSILLSGDIGSGKTSILLGIEFALFGLQPGQKGASLLRNGEDQGKVSLEFVVDGKNIFIERRLKRGKGVTQDYCAVEIDGEKKEISVTELKDKILEILNYPKEFAKKQNLLYKFTVYTPQEEMKTIILQDAQTRINTLRYIFGIDKYKKILENLSILASKLREEKRFNEAMIANFDQDKLEIVKKEEELETKYYNLESIEKELFLKKEKRKKIQEEKEVISKKVEEKKSLEREAEKIKIVASNKEESFTANTKLIDALKLQIQELASLKFDESKLKNLEEEIKQKKLEKRSLDEKNLEITSKITSRTLKMQDNNALKTKVKSLDVCPTCLQDVNENHKANLTNKLDSDMAQTRREIENMNIEKKQLTNKINSLESEISLAQKEMNDLKILKIKLENIDEKKIRMNELLNLNESLQKDKTMLRDQLKSLQESVSLLKKFDVINEEKQTLLEEAKREERFVEIKVAELKKEIEVFSKQIEELKERIKKIQEIQKKLEFLVDLESWVTKKFAPVVSFIEKNVMVKLKHDFSDLFSQWFSMLVSEIFHVHLSDDFTPIIEQQDYELDYSYLSGGERTAIALAYRLALNQVINSLLSKIKTKDFMILDEPTDGFSDAQLDKMRGVLEQLNVGQLVIVSHEQKIEGFVENVIKFKKDAGISKRI